MVDGAMSVKVTFNVVVTWLVGVGLTSGCANTSTEAGLTAVYHSWTEDSWQLSSNAALEPPLATILHSSSSQYRKSKAATQMLLLQLLLLYSEYFSNFCQRLDVTGSVSKVSFFLHALSNKSETKHVKYNKLVSNIFMGLFGTENI